MGAAHYSQKSTLVLSRRRPAWPSLGYKSSGRASCWCRGWGIIKCARLSRAGASGARRTGVFRMCEKMREAQRRVPKRLDRRLSSWRGRLSASPCGTLSRLQPAGPLRLKMGSGRKKGEGPQGKDPQTHGLLKPSRDCAQEGLPLFCHFKASNIHNIWGSLSFPYEAESSSPSPGRSSSP